MMYAGGKTKGERRTTKGRRSGGFTLVEMLTVIFIIITLLGLLGAAIVSAERYSKKAAIQTCLGHISMAIESYYADFSTYPVSNPTVVAGVPDCSYGGTITSGSAGLAEGLMGYLLSAKDGAGVDTGDGAYGFRMTTGGKGQIKGPYFTPNTNAYSSTSATDQYFIDPLGQRILYYRANPSVAVVPGTTTYFSTSTTAVTVTTSLFNAGDNSAISGSLQGYTAPNSATAFLPLIGNLSGNNIIAATDSPTNKNSYLLVSPGPDGNYFDGNNIINNK
jgi:type II secretory pathway pseudopilin PulG